MSKTSEAASRTIVTNMSFIDLADYVFGDTGKELEHVLAISSNDGSKLYEVLAFFRCLLLTVIRHNIIGLDRINQFTTLKFGTLISI